MENADGVSNLEKMKVGLAPIDKLGTKVSLQVHHFDQKQKGAWIVLDKHSHTGPGNFGKIHSRFQPKDGVNRTQFNKEKRSFWKELGERRKHDLKLSKLKKR
jgi:hypothetical protein